MRKAEIDSLLDVCCYSDFFLLHMKPKPNTHVYPAGPVSPVVVWRWGRPRLEKLRAQSIFLFPTSHLVLVLPVKQQQDRFGVGICGRGAWPKQQRLNDWTHRNNTTHKHDHGRFPLPFSPGRWGYSRYYFQKVPPNALLLPIID
jgi:hypothetical protein